MSDDLPKIDPTRNDLVYRAVTIVSRGNPVFTGLVYFAGTYGVLCLVFLVAGRLPGVGSVELTHTFVVDSINLGFLGPVGAGLLCHLYNTIQDTLEKLHARKIIPDESRDAYLEKLRVAEQRYNIVWVPIIALVIALAINIVNYPLKEGTWLGKGGGWLSIFGRLFVLLDFFMLSVVLYKCAVTAWVLRRVISWVDIRVQPLHPDRCGGLGSLGRLALAINYFVTLSLIFFAILFLFDPLARTEPAYILIYALVYACAPILLITPLSKANHRMRERKTEAMDELNRAFNHYYDRLRSESRGDALAMEPAQNIGSIVGLYETVRKLPVWPFDTRSILRFVGPFVVPAVLFVVESLAREDSIIRALMAWLGKAATKIP